ncbi:porin [Gemmobacter megaterium]|nr:porin [Gemmobacter megaterium]
MDKPLQVGENRALARAYGKKAGNAALRRQLGGLGQCGMSAPRIIRVRSGLRVGVAIVGRWEETRGIPNSDSPELGAPLTQRGKTMKKFLIATTALTLSAGVAAAEVKFGGDARLGMNYDGSRVAPAQSKTWLEKRVTINIDASTTADNGVTFGARVRLRSDEVAGTAVNGARVFVRAGGLTVAGGNILGAIESMPGVYAPSVGLTGLAWSGMVTNVTGRYFDWDAYSSRGNGAEGLEVIYTMGDFTGHVSYSSTKLVGVGGATVDTLSAYGAYKFSGWTVALGLADGDAVNDSSDKIVLTVGGKIGDFGVGFGAARNGKGVSKVNKFAINGSYAMGATTISGYVASESGHGAAAAVPAAKTTFGLGASYDLGGGASIVGGVERTNAKKARADLGVSFRF